MIAFFFMLGVAHLDLPIFPTRRSSDLEVRSRRFGRSVESGFLRQLLGVQNRRCGQSAGWHDGAAGGVAWQRALAGGRRSEEHTSELQSRLHLVCRLLLEKKKKKNSKPQ